MNEIHDLILNVYESMDDQSRAVLLALSRLVQDEDKSITLQEKVQAIRSIGHTLCCGRNEHIFIESKSKSKDSFSS